MRHVLHILPHEGGGGEVYVSMLESAPGYVHQRTYLSSGRTPRSAAISMPTRLAGLIHSIRGADLVHVHGDTAAVIVAPLLSTRPAVFTTHGLHLLRRSRGVAGSVTKLGLRAAVAASNVVIATSASERDELARVIRSADREKLRVVLNGVSTPQSISEEARAHTRATLGIAPDTILGLFAGELEPRKEPLLAAAAAARANGDAGSFVLAIAGDGPLRAALASSAGNAVRLLGFRADLDKLMATADAFVHPASREGLSLALLEAMSHGLAVVAADTPGNAEAVGPAGLLFRAGDEIALADAISRVVSDPELRRRLGNEARQRTLDSFAADRFVVQTTDIYTSIVR